jgi:hypothetical protein
MLRGRAPGEVPALLSRALRAAGLQPSQLQRADDEATAALALLDAVREGDLVVLPLHSDDGRAAVAARLVP